MHMPFKILKTIGAVVGATATTVAGAELGSIAGRAAATDVIVLKDMVKEKRWRKNMTPDAILTRRAGFKKKATVSSLNPVTGKYETYVGPNVSLDGVPVLRVKKDGTICKQKGGR